MCLFNDKGVDRSEAKTKRYLIILYNNLHDLIVSGRLPYGSKLPSISELCEFYNIGIRTVKDVLHVLKRRGLYFDP